MLVGFCSCSRNESVPSWAIGQDAMVDLLTDIHLADAYIQSNTRNYNSSDRKDMLYEAVLQKHGINRQQLDTSLYWYGLHTELYKKMYDRILLKLSDEKNTLEERLNLLTAIPTGDSVNIWNRQERWTFLPALQRELMMVIAADTTFHVGDVFRLTGHVSGISADSASLDTSQALLRVSFANDSSTVASKNIKNGTFAVELASGTLNLASVSAFFFIGRHQPRIFIDSIRLWRFHTAVPADSTKTVTPAASPKPEIQKPHTPRRPVIPEKFQPADKVKPKSLL
jgi:hypothetical protein